MAEKLIRPEGHECHTSNILNDLTFGNGELDENGFWEHPCWDCARAHKQQFPEDGNCWTYRGNKMAEFISLEVVDLSELDSGVDPPICARLAAQTFNLCKRKNPMWFNKQGVKPEHVDEVFDYIVKFTPEEPVIAFPFEMGIFNLGANALAYIASELNKRRTPKVFQLHLK